MVLSINEKNKKKKNDASHETAFPQCVCFVYKYAENVYHPYIIIFSNNMNFGQA